MLSTDYTNKQTIWFHIKFFTGRSVAVEWHSLVLDWPSLKSFPRCQVCDRTIRLQVIVVGDYYLEYNYYERIDVRDLNRRRKKYETRAKYAYLHLPYCGYVERFQSKCRNVGRSMCSRLGFHETSPTGLSEGRTAVLYADQLQRYILWNLCLNKMSSQLML